MLQSLRVPESVPEAQALLSRPGASIIAGGTVMMAVLNHGTDSFTSLVSLRRAGLSAITVEGGKATIGAAATLSELGENDALGFLRPALDTIASPTIRNMATVGGNLFVRAPYGDFAACLIALGATASVTGPSGTRIEGVESLVATRAAAGEIVTQLSFALPAPGTFRYLKAGRKALNAAAIVTVAAVVTVTDGKVADCRIALCGVSPRPVRAEAVESALIGQPFDRAHVEAAAERAGEDIDPADDSYASAWYRARVTPVHIRRALYGE